MSPDSPEPGQMTGGFDPGHYTTAPLQTEGTIRFTGPPEAVFARIANHTAMTDWVPLLKTVQVTQPKPMPPGQSMTGTAQVLALHGGVTVREEIVYWNPPHGYAYTTEGKRWPLRDYVGFMGVQAAAGGGDKSMPGTPLAEIDGGYRREALLYPCIAEFLTATTTFIRQAVAVGDPIPRRDERIKDRLARPGAQS